MFPVSEPKIRVMYADIQHGIIDRSFREELVMLMRGNRHEIGKGPTPEPLFKGTNQVRLAPEELPGLPVRSRESRCRDSP